MGDSRVSEEIEDGRQDPESRYRPRSSSAGTIEKGTAAMNESVFDLVEGSGNVFRDFDDPHADLKQAKAVLAARIIVALDDRKLTVRKAASLTGFAAADFSRIRNADLGRFTLDRLMKMIAALDNRVKVTVYVEPWQVEHVLMPSGL